MNAIKIVRGKKDRNSFYVESNYGLLLFDNGAATSQILRSGMTQSLKKVGTKESNGVIGCEMQNIVAVEELRIGDISADDLYVALSDSAGILGNDVLKDYAYTLDTYNDEIVLIEPFTSDISCSIGQRGHLYVEVRIGQQTGMAMIDTGASCSLIDEKFYKEVVGLINDEITETGEDWTGSMFETPIVNIDSLTLGGINFPSHKFAVFDFDKMSFLHMEHPIIAIIGATTMSCKKFSINHIDGYLRIDD